MFSKVGLAALAVVTLAPALAPVARAGEPPARMSKKQLKALIASAKTPEDHMKLAAYYRGEAERLQAKQTEHQEEAAEYYKNPLQHLGPKYPTLGQHCRDLAYYYGKAAESARSLASGHEQMAAIASGGSASTAITSEQQPGPPAAIPPESKPQAMDCTKMMADTSSRTMDVQAMDVQLDQKVAEMNLATGDRKIAAMAAVINELVSQRKAVRDRVLAMQCAMMGQTGASHPPQGDSMSECPMMKDSGGSRSKQ